MLAENAEQEEIARMLVDFISHQTVKETIIKAIQLSNGGNWVVKDSIGAKAAEFAITSKNPERITFIRDEEDEDEEDEDEEDEGTSTLKPSMVSSILANATKRTTVHLYCLDSFFEGGEKSQDWREFLSVCLNNDK